MVGKQKDACPPYASQPGQGVSCSLLDCPPLALRAVNPAAGAVKHGVPTPERENHQESTSLPFLESKLKLLPYRRGAPSDVRGDIVITPIVGLIIL